MENRNQIPTMFIRYQPPFNPTPDVRKQLGDSLYSDIQKSIDKSNAWKEKRANIKKAKEEKRLKETMIKNWRTGICL